MIVITQDLVISPSIPVNHGVIGWHTYTREAVPGDVSVSSETTNGPADAPLRPDTYEGWVPTSVPATWRIDLGTARNINYVGIAGHTIGQSGGAVIVEYSTNDSDWTEFLPEIAPADNTPIVFAVESFDFARYWRIRITSGSAPKIGVIYVGRYLALQRPVRYAGHSPVTMSRTIERSTAETRGGEFVGSSLRRQGMETSYNVHNLKPDWYREEFDRFAVSALRYPYFIAWRPVDYPSEVGFGWTRDAIVPDNSGVRGLIDVSWNFQGIGRGE